MEGFREGYKYFVDNSAGVIAAQEGGNFAIDRINYVESVDEEIEALEKAINDFKGFATSAKMLKGDAAEFWHAHTFNIDAARNRSVTRMMVDRSHDFGSADVSGSDGQLFGLKYYANGEASAYEQAVSVFQRFKEYQAKGGKDDIDKYLSDRGYSDIDAVLNDPIYKGQIRIIPKDQLEDATQWLEKKIITESVKRPDQVKRYQDTLDMLRDKITDGEGNESIGLSKEEAEKLASLGKQGKFDASEFGITSPELVNFEMVMEEAMKAGTTAAVISLVLRVGPEVYKAISYLIKNGEIEESELKRIGFAAISGTAEGFVRGSLAAAITTCCKFGLLGAQAKKVTPAVIAAIITMGINMIKESYSVAAGKKTRNEMVGEMIKQLFVSTCVLIGGGITQAHISIPIISYMIGNFVGSIIGSFVYETGYKATMAFCIDTGFTLFGLVDQDYTLPEDIINQIGVDTFEYETFTPELLEVDTFNIDSFDFERIEPDTIGITYLRRGVIGINRIAYTSR